MPAVRRLPWPAVLAAAVALLAAAGAPAAGGTPAASQPAPPAAAPPAGAPPVNSTERAAPSGLVDLDGRPVDPFAGDEGPAAAATVLLFVRSDCPISNRYAPEVRRIWADFSERGVSFRLVYADPTEPVETIRRSTEDFGYPFPAVRDPEQRIVEWVGATVTPEVAVFDAAGRLVYRGRIDDRWASLGTPRAAPTRRDLVEVLTALVDGQRLEPRTTRAVGCFIPRLEEEPASAGERP